MYYSEQERQRLFKPAESMSFGAGLAIVIMSAEAAHRFAYGLVKLDRETGCYRRASLNTEDEQAIITEKRSSEQLKAAPSMPSAWSARRP